MGGADAKDPPVNIWRLSRRFRCPVNLRTAFVLTSSKQMSQNPSPRNPAVWISLHSGHSNIHPCTTSPPECFWFATNLSQYTKIFRSAFNSNSLELHELLHGSLKSVILWARTLVMSKDRCSFYVRSLGWNIPLEIPFHMYSPTQTCRTTYNSRTY